MANAELDPHSKFQKGMSVLLSKSLVRMAGLALLLVSPVLGGEPKPADVTEPPPRAEFLIVPLRVRLLQSEEIPEIDCALTDEDIARILGKVNGIWHVAGIHFGLESLERPAAENEGRFQAVRGLQGVPPLGVFRVLLPEADRDFSGLKVYYIHEFSVNGVFLGDRVSIVQETSRLRPVEGGIDEPLPRVTAHELGHALSLPHRQDRTNLLASGTTGTLLNTDEVERARNGARKISGVLTLDELQAAAEEATQNGDAARARRLWTWLSEIPGAEAEQARKRLESLDVSASP